MGYASLTKPAATLLTNDAFQAVKQKADAFSDEKMTAKLFVIRKRFFGLSQDWACSRHGEKEVHFLFEMPYCFDCMGDSRWLDRMREDESAIRKLVQRTKESAEDKNVVFTDADIHLLRRWSPAKKEQP
jgi:hypothetical protein